MSTDLLTHLMCGRGDILHGVQQLIHMFQMHLHLLMLLRRWQTRHHTAYHTLDLQNERQSTESVSERVRERG